jgi:hypothetical protein
MFNPLSALTFLPDWILSKTLLFESQTVDANILSFAHAKVRYRVEGRPSSPAVE